MDQPHPNNQLECVIVGTSRKPQHEGQAWCYVLLVARDTSTQHDGYARMGVGRLRRDQIATDASNIVELT
jgi:hypothetical protein